MMTFVYLLIYIILYLIGMFAISLMYDELGLFDKRVNWQYALNIAAKLLWFVSWIVVVIWYIIKYLIKMIIFLYRSVFGR